MGDKPILEPPYGEFLLVDVLAGYEDPTLANAEYIALLAEGVETYNSDYGTNYDPTITVQKYLEYKSAKKKEEDE